MAPARSTDGWRTSHPQQPHFFFFFFFPILLSNRSIKSGIVETEIIPSLPLLPRVWV